MKQIFCFELFLFICLCFIINTLCIEWYNPSCTCACMAFIPFVAADLKNYITLKLFLFHLKPVSWWIVSYLFSKFCSEGKISLQLSTIITQILVRTSDKRLSPPPLKKINFPVLCIHHRRVVYTICSCFIN